MPLPDTALEWIAVLAALWVAVLAILWALCVVAADGDAAQGARVGGVGEEDAAAAPGATPLEVLEIACRAMEMRSMTLFEGDREPLRVVAGGDADHRQIAARALAWSTVVASGGKEEGPWLLATPVQSGGAMLGALAVTVDGRARGMAAATRRDLTRLATLASAALPHPAGEASSGAAAGPLRRPAPRAYG